MWPKAISLSLLVLAAVVAAVVLCGSSRWQAGTRQLHAKLQAARLQPGIESLDLRELEDLPDPAQRYFRAVLKDGQPLISAVDMEQTGTFNMGTTAERWRPFTSSQRVIIHRPGFVWDARFRMAPGMDVFVHDAYVAGEGILVAKLFGLLTVMEQPASSQLAHGELMRFLAEAAWYPTALLPYQGVRWEALGDISARASLTDVGTAVSLEFHFDEAGLISTVRSSGRHRLVDGRPVATPWQGRLWDYEPRHGMLVPLEGEVAWVLQDGPQPYWRGRIRRIEYEYVR